MTEHLELCTCRKCRQLDESWARVRELADIFEHATPTDTERAELQRLLGTLRTGRNQHGSP